MPDPETICGYALSDVRRSLRDAIDRRDQRAANRWTAELVATPGAIGSLWASYWLAWAAAQGAGSVSPSIPILLRQSWETIAEMAVTHTTEGDGWPAFRNDPSVRAIAAEMTYRLREQPRQTPVIWPSRELLTYDVSAMRDSPVPAITDSEVVLRVWDRTEDAMELRLMGGRFLDALMRGDIRAALSSIAWTMLPTHHQNGVAAALKVQERGPAGLTPKARRSPIWFWLSLGKSFLLSQSGLHRGWVTMNSAILDAYRQHYKRWTAVDRMRVLLAWVLQLRAALQTQPASIWTANGVTLTLAEIDLPYKEVAAERADPEQAITRGPPMTAVSKPTTQREEKKAIKSKHQDNLESRMAASDAAVLALLGINDD
jgi:hypothetical protein